MGKDAWYDCSQCLFSHLFLVSRFAKDGHSEIIVTNFIQYIAIRLRATIAVGFPEKDAGMPKLLFFALAVPTSSWLSAFSTLRL
jgi:hypothetical protein